VARRRDTATPAPEPTASDPRVRQAAERRARLEGREMTPADIKWAQELRRRTTEAPLLLRGERQRQAVLARQYERAANG
jgi:hypothetical protein